MRTRSLLLTGIILFITGYGYTQDLPTIKPPPPTAMQFQKYGDYPVSHFTGVPDITIPLYTIKEGDLEVPITLSYHASGFKPTDVDGIVGLGWVLNVGGQMTRTIYDNEDEKTLLSNFGPLPTTSYVSSQITTPDVNTEYYLKDIESKYHYDIFSYDFMGKHGKFIMKNYQLNQCILLDYEPISIEGTLNGFRIGSFTAKDEMGKKYVFQQTAMSDYNTSDVWSISSIQSAIDAANVISYSYVAGPTITFRSRIDMYRKDDNESAESLGSCPGSQYPIDIRDEMDFWSDEISTGNNENGYDTDVPSQINFRNGHVQFTYDPATKLLSSMEVFNKNNELLKRIRFELKTPAYWGDRSLLKKVKFYDRNDNYINEYAFNYDESIGAPAFGATVDYWGYFNENNYSNGDLIPRFYIEFRDWYGNAPSKVVGTSYRLSSETYMKAYQLNAIIYPTGGKSEFEFEANQYNGPRPPGYDQTAVGGLRIKRIRSYSDVNTLSSVKDYEYLVARMDIVPSRPYFTRSSNWYIIAHTMGIPKWYRRTEVSSDPLVNIAPHGSPVVYPYVKEHIRKVLPDGTIDESPANSLTISYTYDYEENNPYSFPTTNGPEGDGFYPLYAPFASIIKANTDGKLTSVTHEGGAYDESISYDYEEIPLEEIPTFYSSRYAFYQAHPCASDMTNPDVYFYQAHWGSNCHLNYGDVTIKPVNKRLRSTSETKQGVTTYTEFHYDNNTHNQPTSKTVTTSNGETIKTVMVYPHEKQSGGTPNVYNEMVARHIWNPVIEESTYKVGSPNQFLQSLKTNYDYWENNTWAAGSASSFIVPHTVQTTVETTGGQETETRINFFAYDDRANVLSVAKENNIKMSYVWGYNKGYPIAEVTNAEVNDVFHTSFEDESDVSIAPEGKTGKKSKTGGFSKSLTNLTNGSYTLSYWQKSGSNWNLVSNTVNISGNTFTISINGQVDEVRFYPSTAFMTTFTFDPMVGKTSETNANNRTEYYEYDAALRLIHILDEDMNVLKKFSYSFYNSATASVTAPNWQMTGNSYCEVCQIDPAFYTGWKISEQIDNNSNSYTYGQKQWVRELSNTCAFNYWQNTGNYMCVKDGGINTGEQMRQQLFINPCSAAYHETRWVSLGTNTNACPVPSVFYSQDISGYYTKSNCPADHAGGDVYVSVPASMFSSPNSLAEANAQAYAYARSVADSDPSGVCTPVPFMLQCENDTEDDIEINLYDPITYNSYTFIAHPSSGYQDLGNILPGTYEVNFHNLDDSIWYYYKLNCGNIEEEGEEVTVLNVPIGSSCNQIQILE